MVLQFPSLSCIVAAFTASTDRVLEILPDPRLRPVQVMPGRCLLVLGALQYRGGDLGAYAEMVVAVPIAFGAHAAPLLSTLRDLFAQAFTGYVWRMPVTSPVSRDAGVEWAGFPKWLAELRFTVGEREAQCILSEDGTPSIVLTCPVDAAPGDRQFELRAHTVRDGVVLACSFVIRQSVYRDHLARSDGARLTLGDGPTARELKGLNLGDRPLVSHWCAEAQGTLHPAHPVTG